MKHFKITDTLTIRINPHSEGGFNVDVYDLEDVDPEEQPEPLDGGIYEGDDLKGAVDMALSIVSQLAGWTKN